MALPAFCEGKPQVFRFLFRLTGLWLLALGFVLLIVDGSRSIADGTLAMASFGELLFDLDPALLSQLQAGVERNLHPFLWDPVIQSVLLVPGWIVTGVLGAGLVLLGARREPVEFTI